MDSVFSFFVNCGIYCVFSETLHAMFLRIIFRFIHFISIKKITHIVTNGNYDAFFHLISFRKLHHALIDYFVYLVLSKMMENLRHITYNLLS